MFGGTAGYFWLSSWLLLISALVGAARGEETPTSYGPAATVDTPVLRVPFCAKAPKIDGQMEPGEWEDASALSGFWYDYAFADFRFMAPEQTQLEVYAMYDKQHLYVAFTSPVWPEGSWLKARGRFPDVLSHPLYGTLWDDHTELEIRPYADMAKGFGLGLLRWDVNPIGTLTDWYWTKQNGHDFKWKSYAKVRCSVTDKRWIIEYAIPFACMRAGHYKGAESDGRPLVTLPPPAGTIYRAWFTRGIGGCGSFFNAFDAHAWNTCKTQLILDPQAVGFQVNALGPIMEDKIDVQLTVKNHNTRSETVRLGFFVENAAETIYSSYASDALKDGLLELVPGEVRKIRLRQPFPGVSRDGNVLWFDVRSAGQPAKVLFRTRLIRFHSMDGGETFVKGHRVQNPVTKEFTDEVTPDRTVSFMERRVNVIRELRPPRQDFGLRWNVSSYTRQLSMVVDRGIAGASEKAKSAEEVLLLIFKNDASDTEVKKFRFPFHGAFACLVTKVPELVEGESYRLAILLFDAKKRIVGDRETDPFMYRGQVWPNNNFGMDRNDAAWERRWKDNSTGLDDVVWEGMEPMKVTDRGFETGKHRFGLGPTGLPSQIHIKPDPRELPLEARGDGAALTPAGLLELGRGDQLREPVRLEAVVGEQRLAAQAKAPARLAREWKSELEYTSALRIGPLEADLTVRYDCDGSMHVRLVYGGEQPAKVDGLELVMPVDGLVDLALSETGYGGMTGADKWECSLPATPGVVWDSRDREIELRRGRFVPWFWFGSGDRAFSWMCDNDEGWMISHEGSTLSLERDAAGKITWRVRFINRPVEVKGRRTIEFTILTHPAKSKPANWRRYAWHYAPSPHGRAPGGAPWQVGEKYLQSVWRQWSWAPKDWPEEKKNEWRKDDPPHGSGVSFSKLGSWVAENDRIYEDLITFYAGRVVSIGRAVGWWQDECWPLFGGVSDNLAMNNAYLRDPATVGADELPWQGCWPARNYRNYYKRLARIHAASNVPNRQFTWANNAATAYESFIWHCKLVEECGAMIRAYEVDQLVQFPNSLYRYMAHNWSGLITEIGADAMIGPAGDDKRADRIYLGIALLHDIGANLYNAHGSFQHREQCVRLIDALTRFGFFEDTGIEKLPFWRNEPYVSYGGRPSAETQVYVTVYRRAREGGGYQALFVLLNESDGPVEMPLRIRAPQRILGGPNTLRAGAVRAKAELPEAVQAWSRPRAQLDAQSIVLRDVETGDIVAPVNGEPETYGPIHLPYHDFRVLYAEWERIK